MNHLRSTKDDRRADITWIVTDGTVGMEAQGIAVAEAIGLRYSLKRVQVTGPLRWLPKQMQIYVPSARYLRSVASNKSLGPPWPRLILSVGQRSVATALALKRIEPQALAVHIQNPSVPLRHFDWIVAPVHDAVSGSNVLATMGAVHRITPARLSEAKGHFSDIVEGLPHPRIAVLLGGRSRAFEFTSDDAAQFGSSLALLASASLGSLLVTPSQRTGPEALAAFSRNIANIPHFIWNGTGANPYLALLAFADAIVVTGDSVNMVTEAVGTGKPVYIKSLRGKSRRNERFHSMMRKAGATRPFAGRLESWSYAPINDTELVATVIRRALGLDQLA